MKLVLPEALHARPANLLVRLVAQHGVSVELRKGACRADARKILDVLSLGAAKGDEIEIAAVGEGAERAVQAVAELVSRNFDGDLVPEVGSGAVEGIAVGRALVVSAPEPAVERTAGAPHEEQARLVRAEVQALAELDALIECLAPEERPLFEPERVIVREVAEAARAKTCEGLAAEEAVTALTEAATTDLMLDARARLLEALARGDEAAADVLARAEEFGEEVVLVAPSLTPSLVARLPPRVRGIVAVDEEPEAGRTRTSHAAILARGREIPLALVPSHVALAIAEGEAVVLDTTVSPARVWVSPSESLIGDARVRQAKHRAGGVDESAVADAAAAVVERHAVKLLVNVGSLHDRVPAGAEGVGLLRTELLFAGRTTAPTEGDQVASLLAVARAARGKVVTARLWDAGGDKPLAWLPGSSSDSRGVELLFEHPTVLRTQLKAFARAAERAPIRALIPMTRGPADVTAVRAGLPGHRVPVGAMIETPEAARDASAIAEVADFVCIGTNDLSALTLGAARADAAQALDLRVLRLLARVIESVHACGKEVTICGEVAGDPLGAAILVGLGVDALSVAPPRFPSTSRALAEATVDQCEAAARRALGTERSHG